MVDKAFSYRFQILILTQPKFKASHLFKVLLASRHPVANAKPSLGYIWSWFLLIVSKIAHKKRILKWGQKLRTTSKRQVFTKPLICWVKIEEGLFLFSQGCGVVFLATIQLSNFSHSSSVRAKSNIAIFSLIWSGFCEPGKTILPFWICQRRMIWAGDLPYFIASLLKIASLSKPASPWPRGYQLSILVPSGAKRSRNWSCAW